MTDLSRRSFLKTTALATAAGLAAPAALGANERIRVAILGCRNRGHQVAEEMTRNRAFEIATLCDCDTAMIDIATKELGSRIRRKPKARNRLP